MSQTTNSCRTTTPPASLHHSFNDVEYSIKETLKSTYVLLYCLNDGRSFVKPQLSERIQGTIIEKPKIKVSFSLIRSVDFVMLGFISLSVHVLAKLDLLCE